MLQAQAAQVNRYIPVQESGPPAKAPAQGNLAWVGPATPAPAGPPPPPPGPPPGDTHPAGIRAHIPMRGQPAGVFKPRPHDDWDVLEPGCAPPYHAAMVEQRRQMAGAPMWHWSSFPPGIKIRVGDQAAIATNTAMSARIQSELRDWCDWAQGHNLTPHKLWEDVISVIVGGGEGVTDTGSTYVTVTVCSVRSSSRS